MTEALSQYATFHFQFKGYCFKCTETGRILTKSQFWDKYRELAKMAGKNGQAPSGYTLVDSPGWKNGKLISQIY